MPEHIVPMERITSKIYIVRDTRVMLDRDLAELYGVETRTLKQAVRRNLKRFPADFMFELSYQEFRNLTSQSVTSKNFQTWPHLARRKAADQGGI
jgi:hypothetical protein